MVCFSSITQPNLTRLLLRGAEIAIYFRLCCIPVYQTRGRAIRPVLATFHPGPYKIATFVGPGSQHPCSLKRVDYTP